MKTCKTCRRPIRGNNMSRVTRCLICRTDDVMKTFAYTPDPYAVAEYRQDEATWAARPEVQHAQH